MEPVFIHLLIMMAVVWSAAMVLRWVGIPIIMGELVMGIIVGPAVLGWISPSDIIDVLAEMGIFFIMLHAGVKTDPAEFFTAIKLSVGVALVGAAVPFCVAFAIAIAFDLSIVQSLFVGLTMTATAVVITITILEDLKLQQTRIARVIVASCVLDDLLTLILFGLMLGLINGNSADPVSLMVVVGKAILFFAAVIAFGHWVYPKLKEPFQDRHGKVFTFIILLALGFGLFAQAIGLHIIVGGYLAGLFFTKKVAIAELFDKVEDRLHAIAYSFLGPIFFVSLGFHITFDAVMTPSLWFVLTLTAAVVIGQILSAGVMARLVGFDWPQSFTVGVGMCGRAEMAYLLSSVGLHAGLFDARIFSVLIFTSFLLNLITPLGLLGCNNVLRRTNDLGP